MLPENINFSGSIFFNQIHKMSFKIHSFSTAKTSTWTGGETREFFIFPLESSYLERNFEFRISSATIEVVESDFTALPAYERLLVVLEGELELDHENQYTNQLKPLDSDSFSGSWKTKSLGKARDFNVIFAENWRLSHEIIQTNKTTTISNSGDFCFLLSLEKQVVNDISVEKYDLLELNSSEIQLPKNSSYLLFLLKKLDL